MNGATTHTCTCAAGYAGVNCTIPCVDSCAAGTNGGCMNGGTCNRPSFSLSTCVPALVTTNNTISAAYHSSFFQLTSAAAFSGRYGAGLVQLNDALVLLHGEDDSVAGMNTVYATSNAYEWSAVLTPALLITQANQAYVSDPSAGVYYFTRQYLNTVYRVDNASILILPVFADQLTTRLQYLSMLLLNSTLHILGGE
jgi:hypothetical protein